MMKETEKAPAVSPKPINTTRPIGVTVICVLGFLVSILMLIAGFALAGLSGILESLGLEAMGTSGTGIVFIAISVIFIIIGVACLVAFYLLLKMRKIGMIAVVILGIISIISSIIQFSTNQVVSIVIWLIIIFYLLVKRELFVQ